MFALAGFSFMWPLTSIYVTHELGKSMTAAGLVLSLEALSGIAGSFIGGLLFDWKGAKFSMVLASCIIVASNLLLIAHQDWITFLVAFSAMTLCIGMLLTSVNAAAGIVWPDGGRKPFTLNYICQNIGVALGTSLGGFVSSVSFTYAFMLNALFFSFAAAVIIFGIHIKKRAAAEGVQAALPAVKGAAAWRQFMTLALIGMGAAFIMISYIQWQTTVPLLMEQLGFSLGLYSLLWTINGLLVIVLQPLNVMLDRMFSAERYQFLFGSAALIISFLLLLNGGGYGSFVAAMVLATIGEIVIWPVIPAAASQLAPPGREGFFQGLINACSHCGRLIGPIVGTSVYQVKGSSVMLWVMVIFYVLALISFLWSMHLRSSAVHKTVIQNHSLLANEQ